MSKPKLLVILGPTASGKSRLAIELAKKFNGEVVSADSRQVYKGLNLGTGKVTKKEMAGVKHHLLDVVEPKKTFNVVQYKETAQQVISDIHSRGKLPILCGGTGFYIQAIVDDIVFPDVPPNPKLRAQLEKISTQKLYAKLVKIDPIRAKDIDVNNKTKIIRALEIAKVLGKVPKIKKSSPYNCRQIGIFTPDQELREKINVRLTERLTKGMIREVSNLHKHGLSWRRMFALGLEYRFLSLYLQKKISKKEMVESLQNEIWHYARRQRTWFKRDNRIKWFSLKELTTIEKAVKGFVK
jgi:tRNA dimethylallyltransferase